MVAYSVHDLADEIYGNEFEYDSGYAQFYYISGWLANNVGMLNTKIYSQYAVESGNFIPTGCIFMSFIQKRLVRFCAELIQALIS
jgi:hypothetical protein